MYYKEMVRRLVRLNSCLQLQSPKPQLRVRSRHRWIRWAGSLWRRVYWSFSSRFSPPTAMSISSESSASRLISKSEFLSSLPPWRRFLAKLNWHPTIDAQIRVLESERREKESERRTKLIESDIERLQNENKRLAELESKLDSLLLNADSSSQAPPETDCN